MFQKRSIYACLISVMTLVAMVLVMPLTASAQNTITRQDAKPKPTKPNHVSVKPTYKPAAKPSGWRNSDTYVAPTVSVPQYDVVSHEGNGRKRVTAATKCCYGDDYFYGENGKPVDYDMAIYWYVQSAQDGYMHAQNNLGFCYEKGKGVEKNLEAAAFWYYQAAVQGLAIAQCNVGNCYRYGWGVEVDLAEARRWYRLAAENGDDEARRLLNNL